MLVIVAFHGGDGGGGGRDVDDADTTEENEDDEKGSREPVDTSPKSASPLVFIDKRFGPFRLK